MPQDEALVGTIEASRILDVAPVTITRWVADGRLKPYHKMPGKNGAYLFRREDVEQLAQRAAS